MTLRWFHHRRDGTALFQRTHLEQCPAQRGWCTGKPADLCRGFAQRGGPGPYQNGILYVAGDVKMTGNSGWGQLPPAAASIWAAATASGFVQRCGRQSRFRRYTCGGGSGKPARSLRTLPIPVRRSPATPDRGHQRPAPARVVPSSSPSRSAPYPDLSPSSGSNGWVGGNPGGLQRGPSTSAPAA